MISKKYLQIGTAFARALRTGKTEEIDAIPTAEIKAAKAHLILDKNYPHYVYMVDYLNDREHKESKTLQKLNSNQFVYVHGDRIEALKKLESSHFDFSKLVRLCEELNIAFNNECYFSCVMLLRAIIDHLPPVFGFNTFREVVNNYSGTKSFKEIIVNFEKALRPIADGYLHEKIRNSESLPTSNTVNFSAQLDKLLEEVCRITK